MVNCQQLYSGCGNCVSYADCGWCDSTDSCANLSDDDYWTSQCSSGALRYCNGGDDTWLEDNYIWLSTISTFLALIAVCLCVCVCCRLGAAGRRGQAPIYVAPPPPRDSNQPPTVEEMNRTAMPQQPVYGQPAGVYPQQQPVYIYPPQYAAPPGQPSPYGVAPPANPQWTYPMAPGNPPGVSLGTQ